MNILTKNRIIEKGDEFRHTDGRWLRVPDQNVGLQVLYSEYKEVRRPSEKPISKPISPDSGLGACTENPAKAEKEKAPVPTPSGTGDTHLPTVISRKAHADPALDAMEREQDELAAMARIKGMKITFYPAAIEYSDLSAMPNWIGRNGTFKATGLNVSRTKADLIQLRPIGKRGLAKNALIEIPVKDVAKLIDRLTALKER